MFDDLADSTSWKYTRPFSCCWAVAVEYTPRSGECNLVEMNYSGSINKWSIFAQIDCAMFTENYFHFSKRLFSWSRILTETIICSFSFELPYSILKEMCISIHVNTIERNKRLSFYGVVLATVIWGYAHSFRLILDRTYRSFTVTHENLC